MKRRLLFVFCLVLACVATVSAQQTITNSSLQKYADQRIAADREYRETYQKRGMPSPEQLEKWSEQDRAETAQLAARLQDATLQREWLATQLMISQQDAAAPAFQNYGASSSYYDPYISSFDGVGFGRDRGFGIRGRVQQSGYFAGGQFWPTPGLTRSAPIIRIGVGGRIGGHR